MGSQSLPHILGDNKAQYRDIPVSMYILLDHLILGIDYLLHTGLVDMGLQWKILKNMFFFYTC